MRIIKVFLLCLSFTLLSGCIASSKHVKKLDKIVEAIAVQQELIINAMSTKGLLTVEQADAMTKNATIITESSHKQVEETASIWTLKIFTWNGFQIALGIVAKGAKDFIAGNWVGLGMGLLTAATTYVIKNKQTVQAVTDAVTENDLWHKEDKVKLVAKVLVGEDQTKKYTECKDNACKIVEAHEAV